MGDEMHWIAGEKIEENELVYQDPKTLKLFAVRDKPRVTVTFNGKELGQAEKISITHHTKEFQEALDISNKEPPTDSPDYGAGV